jgi:hypothetical protein
MKILCCTTQKTGGFIPFEDNPTLATPIELQELTEFSTRGSSDRICGPPSATVNNKDRQAPILSRLGCMLIHVIDPKDESSMPLS